MQYVILIKHSWIAIPIGDLWFTVQSLTALVFHVFIGDCCRLKRYLLLNMKQSWSFKFCLLLLPLVLCTMFTSGWLYEFTKMDYSRQFSQHITSTATSDILYELS